MKSKYLCESVMQVAFDIKAKAPIQILWFADLHYENPQTDKSKIKKIINDNPDAFIVIGGDAFDLMEAFGDPRQDKSRQRDMGYGTDFINEMTDGFISFFEPYAHRILAINFGNHESSFVKRHGIDLALLVSARLNERTGSHILCGDYAGYIELLFVNGRNSLSQLVYFSHSSGSIGKRSKGALAIDILKGQVPSADIIITEHDHETFIHPSTVEIFDDKNKKLKDKRVWFCSVPTMKDEHKGVKRGFHHEKNMGKRTIGCIRLDIHWNHTNGKRNLKVEPRYCLFD